MEKYERNELLTRPFPAGTTVTNCVTHMHRSILERPQDCELCQVDIRNTLSRALRANQWLNQWKEDATKLIASDTV